LLIAVICRTLKHMLKGLFTPERSKAERSKDCKYSCYYQAAA